MNKPWIKLWTDDLWASYNFQSLTVYQKGIYCLLLSRCRKHDYPGQFCFPNGNPMKLDDIIDQLLPQQGDRRDRVKEAVDQLILKGMLLWNAGLVLEVRKFAEKSQKKTTDVAGKLSRGGAETPHGQPTEEEEEEEDIKNEEKKILLNYEVRGWENITEKDLSGWKETYPALDVDMELKKMIEWCLSNPKNKKSNWRRFITNWLSRGQDSAPARGGMNGTSNSGQGKAGLNRITCPDCKGKRSLGGGTIEKICIYCDGNPELYEKVKNRQCFCKGKGKIKVKKDEQNCLTCYSTFEKKSMGWIYGKE